jgi:hypothetical protein
MKKILLPINAYANQKTMIKRYLLITALTVASVASAFSQPYDKNHAWHNSASGQTLYASAMIYPHALDTEWWAKKFADVGLWFSVGPNPPQLWVNYMTDPEGDKQLKVTGQWRPFVCVGRIGSKLPIYCVNAATERDDTVLIDAFVAGYELRTKAPLAGPPEDSGNAATTQ